MDNFKKAIQKKRPSRVKSDNNVTLNRNTVTD